MSNKTEGLLPQSPPRIPGFTRLSSKIYNLKYSLLDDTSPAAVMTKSQALQSNLDVDYVISYRFAKTGESVYVIEGGLRTN
jgi:anoctamin-10